MAFFSSAAKAFVGHILPRTADLQREKVNLRHGITSRNGHSENAGNENSTWQPVDMRMFGEEVARLEAVNSTLNEEMAKIRGELEKKEVELQAVHDKAVTLEGQIAKMRGELARKDVELQAAHDASDEQRQTQEELRTVKKRFEKLKKAMFDWHKKQVPKGENDNQISEVARLQATNTLLEEQIAQSREELAKKHDELRAAHSALSRVEQLQHRAQDLQQVENKDKANEEIQKPLNSEDLDSHGAIKTNTNKSKEFTILLVGEIGVGKTMLLSLLANIVLGHNPEQFVNFNEESIEADPGGANHHQTKEAKIYKFTSSAGDGITILDTPGLADTRDLAQDESHKARIASVIKENITTINAVIILINGTALRLGIATDYALSTLSSILPRSLADNIGILFTHVSSPLSWNFDEGSLPDFLRGRDDCQWLLDNPLAMWNKYLQIKAQPNVSKKVLSGLLGAVNEGHQAALKVSKSMFDWLDGLKPQPTSDIMGLYEKYLQMNRDVDHTMLRMAQILERKRKVTKVKELAELAKKEKSKYETMVVALQELTADFDLELEETLLLLGRLTDSYAQLSLSGSFAGQVKKSVKLLEANLEDMRQSQADVKSIETIEKRLGYMKRKLNVVEAVDGKADGSILEAL